MMNRREAGPVQALWDLLVIRAEQAQTSEEIEADLDPICVANATVSLFFQRLVLWHHGHRLASLAELIDHSVDLLLDGVETRFRTGFLWSMAVLLHPGPTNSHPPSA